MKKLATLFAILMLSVMTLFAQAPKKFSYQAVVRNASNQLVTNTLVGIRISILQNSANGSVVYSETQMLSTNANGLVTLNIGDAEGYEEWTYTTVSGTEVQLSMSPDRCVLMADLPDAFVAVNLLGGTAGNSVFMPEPVTAADLQAFADMFNFSALA